MPDAGNGKGQWQAGTCRAAAVRHSPGCPLQLHLGPARDPRRARGLVDPWSRPDQAVASSARAQRRRWRRSWAGPGPRCTSARSAWSGGAGDAGRRSRTWWGWSGGRHREPGLAASSCRRVARARLPSAGTPGTSLRSANLRSIFTLVPLPCGCHVTRHSRAPGGMNRDSVLTQAFVVTAGSRDRCRFRLASL